MMEIYSAAWPLASALEMRFAPLLIAVLAPSVLTKALADRATHETVPTDRVSSNAAIEQSQYGLAQEGWGETVQLDALTVRHSAF